MADQFNFKYQRNASDAIVNFFREAKRREDRDSSSQTAYDDLQVLDSLTKEKVDQFGKEDTNGKINNFKVIKVDLDESQTGDEFYIEEKLAQDWLPRAVAVYDFDNSLGSASLNLYRDFGAVDSDNNVVSQVTVAEKVSANEYRAQPNESGELRVISQGQNISSYTNAGTIPQDNTQVTSISPVQVTNEGQVNLDTGETEVTSSSTSDDSVVTTETSETSITQSVTPESQTNALQLINDLRNQWDLSVVDYRDGKTYETILTELEQDISSNSGQVSEEVATTFQNLPMNYTKSYIIRETERWKGLQKDENFTAGWFNVLDGTLRKIDQFRNNIVNAQDDQQLEAAIKEFYYEPDPENSAEFIADQATVSFYLPGLNVGSQEGEQSSTVGEEYIDLFMQHVDQSMGIIRSDWVDYASGSPIVNFLTGAKDEVFENRLEQLQELRFQVMDLRKNPSMARYQALQDRFNAYMNEYGMANQRIHNNAIAGAQTMKTLRNASAIAAAVVGSIIAAPAILSAAGAYGTGLGLAGGGLKAFTLLTTTVGTGLVGGTTSATSGAAMNFGEALSHNAYGTQELNKQVFGNETHTFSSLHTDFGSGFKAGAFVGGTTWGAQQIVGTTWAQSVGGTRWFKDANQVASTFSTMGTSTVGEGLDLIMPGGQDRALWQRGTSILFSGIAGYGGASQFGSTIQGDLVVGTGTAGLESLINAGGINEQFTQEFISQLPTEIASAMTGQQLHALSNYRGDSRIPFIGDLNGLQTAGQNHRNRIDQAAAGKLDFENKAAQNARDWWLNNVWNAGDQGYNPNNFRVDESGNRVVEYPSPDGIDRPSTIIVHDPSSGKMTVGGRELDINGDEYQQALRVIDGHQRAQQRQQARQTNANVSPEQTSQAPTDLSNSFNPDNFDFTQTGDNRRLVVKDNNGDTVRLIEMNESGRITIDEIGSEGRVLNYGDADYDTYANLIAIQSRTAVARRVVNNRSLYSESPGERTLTLSDGKVTLQESDGTIVLETNNGTSQSLRPGDPEYDQWASKIIAYGQAHRYSQDVDLSRYRIDSNGDRVIQLPQPDGVPDQELILRPDGTFALRVNGADSPLVGEQMEFEALLMFDLYHQAAVNQAPVNNPSQPQNTSTTNNQINFREVPWPTGNNQQTVGRVTSSSRTSDGNNIVGVRKVNDDNNHYEVFLSDPSDSNSNQGSFDVKRYPGGWKLNGEVVLNGQTLAQRVQRNPNAAFLRDGDVINVNGNYFMYRGQGFNKGIDFVPIDQPTYTRLSEQNNNRGLFARQRNQRANQPQQSEASLTNQSRGGWRRPGWLRNPIPDLGIRRRLNNFVEAHLGNPIPPGFTVETEPLAEGIGSIYKYSDGNGNQFHVVIVRDADGKVTEKIATPIGTIAPEIQQKLLSNAISRNDGQQTSVSQEAASVVPPEIPTGYKEISNRRSSGSPITDTYIFNSDDGSLTFRVIVELNERNEVIHTKLESNNPDAVDNLEPDVAEQFIAYALTKNSDYVIPDQASPLPSVRTSNQPVMEITGSPISQPHVAASIGDFQSAVHHDAIVITDHRLSELNGTYVGYDWAVQNGQGPYTLTAYFGNQNGGAENLRYIQVVKPDGGEQLIRPGESIEINGQRIEVPADPSLNGNVPVAPESEAPLRPQTDYSGDRRGNFYNWITGNNLQRNIPSNPYRAQPFRNRLRSAAENIVRNTSSEIQNKELEIQQKIDEGFDATQHDYSNLADLYKARAEANLKLGNYEQAKLDAQKSIESNQKGYTTGYSVDTHVRGNLIKAKLFTGESPDNVRSDIDTYYSLMEQRVNGGDKLLTRDDYAWKAMIEISRGDYDTARQTITNPTNDPLFVSDPAHYAILYYLDLKTHGSEHPQTIESLNKLNRKTNGNNSNRQGIRDARSYEAYETWLLLKRLDGIFRPEA